MRYAVVDQSGMVVNAIEWDGAEGFSIPDHQMVPSEVAGIGWQYLDGVFSAPDSAPMTEEEWRAAEMAKYEDAVQSLLDDAAKAARYDNINTAVSYADEPAVEKFQIEGQAFRAWRSLCWAHCYQALADFEQGLRAPPTVQDLLDELPVLTLPAA